MEKKWAECKHTADNKFENKDGHYWAYVNTCTQKKLGLKHISQESEGTMGILEIGKHNSASHICAGLETIDFQHDSFGKNIETLIQAIYDEIGDRTTSFLNPMGLRAEISKSRTVNMLTDLIKKRLGLSVRLIVKTVVPGAVMPFYYSTSNVMVTPEWRTLLHGETTAIPKAMRDVAMKQRGRQGTVNLKQAKLGGIFSEYVHDLNIDFVGNKERGMSPGEQTAILLHELGHGFTYYEFSDRIDSVNRVMQTLTEELFSDDKEKDLTYLYDEVVKITSTTKDELETIRKGNRLIMGPRMLTIYIKMVGSCMPHTKYDSTASEQLADNFAARFGYGRELITSLQKLHGISPETIDSPLFAQILGNVGLIIDIVITISALVAGSPVAVQLALYFTALAALRTLTSGESDRDMTYDDLKSRYIRIRQQYIELMKNLELPQDKLKEALNTVEQMDAVIKKTRDFSDLFRTAANFFLSSNAAAKKDIEAQKLIEELINNDLFLAAAKLRAESA